MKIVYAIGHQDSEGKIWFVSGDERGRQLFKTPDALYAVVRNNKDDLRDWFKKLPQHQKERFSGKQLKIYPVQATALEPVGSIRVKKTEAVKLDDRSKKESKIVEYDLLFEMD